MRSQIGVIPTERHTMSVHRRVQAHTPHSIRRNVGDPILRNHHKDRDESLHERSIAGTDDVVVVTKQWAKAGCLRCRAGQLGAVEWSRAAAGYTGKDLPDDRV